MTSVFLTAYTTTISSQQTLTVPNRNILPDTPQPQPPRWKVDPRGSIAFNTNNSRIYYSDGVAWRTITTGATVLTLTPLTGDGTAGNEVRIISGTSTGQVILYNNTTSRWVIAPAATFKGVSNIGIGSGSMSAAITTGNGCSALGVGSMEKIVTTAYCVAVGYNSMNAQTGGSHNVAVGPETLLLTTTVVGNTVVGSLARNAATVGNSVIAIGQACAAGSSGDSCIWIGNAAGDASTGTDIIGIGGSTMLAATKTGTIGIGLETLTNLTTGDQNIGIGYKVLGTLATGSRNIGIGYNVLANLGGSGTATDCISIGATMTGAGKAVGLIGIGTNALLNADVIGDSIGIGTNALKTFTNGGASTSCIGIGTNAGTAISTGAGNIAIGTNALLTCIVGANNIAIGNSALTLVTGGTNVAIGSFALKTAAGADANVAVGNAAAQLLTSGDNNVSIGSASFPALTTGSGNIAIGDSAGAGHSTGTNSIVIGNTTNTGNFSSVIILGNGITAAANNDFIIPSANIPVAAAADTMNVTIAGAVATISRVVSSRRFKKDIRDLEVDSSLIYKLQERSFEIVREDGYSQTDFGFVAEEAEEIGLKQLITYDRELVSGFKYMLMSVLHNRELKKHQELIDDLYREIEKLKSRT